MSKVTAIVLAAGKGRRMKGPDPKVLREACGQPVIYYVLKEISNLKNIGQVIVVVGFKAELIQDAVKRICDGSLKKLEKKIQFVHQSKMLGTADAVRVALKKVNFNRVLVTCGDNPLIRSKTLSSLLSLAKRKSLNCCLLTSFLERKNQLGKVFYDQRGKPKAIKERKSPKSNIEGRQSNSLQSNSGTYYFTKSVLSKNLSKIELNPKKKEYFLTDIIEILYRQGERLDSFSIKDSSEVAGVNSPDELCFAQEKIKERIIKKFIESGVDIINPQTTIIQEPVKIGKGTVIYPFTLIEKNAIIGQNCQVGPFIRIRGNTCIKSRAVVGNFLEVNRSQLGRKVKAKHFGYLGDVVVSDNVNVGAGTVVANYDGKNKHKTYIKKDALLGCDTVLVAPVTVGKGAVTGAGAVVTKDIKENQVVVGIPARFLKAK